MTETEIKTMFTEAIKERGVYKKINVSWDVIYNWKNNRGSEPTLGQMLEALYRLELIKLSKNVKE